MKSTCFIVFFTLTVFGVTAQNSRFPVDVEKMTRNNIYAGNGFASDMEKDTLCLENGQKLLFKHSPLIFFDGYSKLFQDYDVVVLIGNGQKGFTCTFVEKNKKLYLEKVRFLAQAGGDLENIPTEEEWWKRLSALTGEDFDSNNLLPANWMSGAFAASAIHLDPFHKGLTDFEQEYIFYLKKGKVDKIKLQKRELIDIDSLPSNLEINTTK